MENQKKIAANYTVAMEVSKSPGDVFSHFINLKKWWPEDFEGEDIKLNTEFILTTGDSHYSKNRVVEFVPGKKLVWVATESLRKADNFDWTGTRMIFEVIPKGNNTVVKFTYDGVVFENEYDRLVRICDMTLNELFYNFIESYTATIEVAETPQHVFKSITNDVAKWWGGNDLTGNSLKLNDEFVICHPGAHYSKQKLVEVIPDRKIVWQVTESKLDWLSDQAEWTNTKMIFEITTKEDKTILQFAHEGLVPRKECYIKCVQGWNMVVKDWLVNFITAGEVKILDYHKKMKSFHRSISVNISANDAMEKINKVPEWWGVTFSGDCEKQHDKFVIKMGGDSYFSMTVAELIPGKKIVWLVTDCNMPWYADKKEWRNSKLIFDVIGNNGATTVTFTHEGLTPDVECYKDCEPGWNHWITRSLVSYLTTGKGDFKQR